MRFVRYFYCMSIVCVIAFTGCGLKHNENIPHDSIRLQAKADAESDARRDVNLLTYFGAGASAPFAAAMCGLTGVCLYDLIAEFRDATLPCIGSAMGAAAVMNLLIGYYIGSPNPPPERLIGKSPEYVTFYADAYREKMRSYRTRSVVLGSAFSCVILTCVGFSFLPGDMDMR